MGSSGSSSGVGSDMVLRIEPEFGVRSCDTRSCNKKTVFAESGKDLADVCLMLCEVVRVDEDIIEVNHSAYI